MARPSTSFSKKSSAIYLLSSGLGKSEVARRLGLHRNTIGNWAKEDWGLQKTNLHSKLNRIAQDSEQVLQQIKLAEAKEISFLLFKNLEKLSTDDLENIKKKLSEV
jgi:hypothetical protein